VGTLDKARPRLGGQGIDPVYRQVVEADCRAYNIYYGVYGPNLMKVYFIDCSAVYLGLGYSQPMKDINRARLNPRRKSAGIDNLLYVREPSLPVAMLITMTVIVVLAVVTMLMLMLVIVVVIMVMVIMMMSVVMSMTEVHVKLRALDPHFSLATDP
jgi:hypothetical protein